MCVCVHRHCLYLVSQVGQHGVPGHQPVGLHHVVQRGAGLPLLMAEVHNAAAVLVGRLEAHVVIEEVVGHVLLLQVPVAPHPGAAA